MTMPDLHSRTVPVELELSEGQLFGRLVPFDVAATVADLTPGGKIDIYEEGFRKGVFSKQALSTEPGVRQRVALRHEHDDPLRQGVLMTLEERDDGAYGEFMILPSYRDNWRAMHEVGIRELSIEFTEGKNGTSVENDVRWRTMANLHGVALVARGAYGAVGAEVLAIRSIDELVAEQAEQREAERDAERQRLEAETAAEAEAAEAEQRRRALEEISRFVADAQAKQVELEQRYSIAG